MNSAVERAIKLICDQYGEPLSLDDLAESAILSRFHFLRIFTEATGVTPGRFLSAVRIYQAKRMLVTTAMKVTDIAFAVGYNSLGSFSNHFTASVGIAPGRFRRSWRHGMLEFPGPNHNRSGGAVTGDLVLPPGYVGAHACVGVFDSPIIQHQPAAAAVVEVPPDRRVARFDLGHVHKGAWFIHALAVTDSEDVEPWTRRTLLVGSSGLVTMTGHDLHPRIELRTRRPTDLPILLALPELEPGLARYPTAETAPVVPFPRYGEMVGVPGGARRESAPVCR